MKPQPFSSLNHLTVPTATVGLLVSLDPTCVGSGGNHNGNLNGTRYRVKALVTNKFLGPADLGPRRRVLDNPTQRHQLVAKLISARPVLSGPRLVASAHQIAGVLIHVIATTQ